MNLSPDLHHAPSTAMPHSTPARHKPRDTLNLHDVVNHLSPKGDHHWFSIHSSPHGSFSSVVMGSRRPPPPAIFADWSSPASSIRLVVQEDAAGAGGGGRGSGGGIASWGEDDAYLRFGEARTQNALSVWVLRWTVFFGTQNNVCDAKWVWVARCMLCWR